MTVVAGEWRYSRPVPNRCTVIQLASWTRPVAAKATFCLSLTEGKSSFQGVSAAVDPVLISIPAAFSPFWRRVALRGSNDWQGIWTLHLRAWVPPMPLSPDTDPSSSTTGTTTSVAAAITSTQLLAANTNRKSLTIYNNSLATLYVGFGATVSPTTFALKVGSNTLWEEPTDYDGPVFGVWSFANGNALITEFA